MENNKKQIIENKMKEIENFFIKGKSENEWGELQWIKFDFKVRKGMGILEASSKANPLTTIVGICTKWIEENGDEAEWLVAKRGLGLTLTTAEKVELAKYHCSLTYLLIWEG